MTYSRPDLLVAVPVVLALLTLAVTLQWRRGRRLVEAYGGKVPAERLLGRDLSRFPAARLAAVLLASTALVLAAADPQPEDPPPPPPLTPIDLMVVVDVSHSMSAADVSPSRVERARALVEGLVEESLADRVSLSIFADWPFGLVPLTDDGDVITFFAPWVAPDLMGTRDQGTSLPVAIGSARAAWERRARDDARRIILVVTDGEIHEGRDEVLDSVGAVGDDGFEIWTAGVGTTGGAPLFLTGADGAPLLYDGSQVIAGYDEELLRGVATRGRGSFHDISTDSGLRSLFDALERDRPAADGTEDVGRSPAFWLLAAAFLLLVVETVLDSGALSRHRRSGGAPRDRPRPPGSAWKLPGTRGGAATLESNPRRAA